MITFTIIAIVVIIIIKFLMYSSKPENQIEANDIRKKFKPFIDTIINSYMQNNVTCSVVDVDDDKCDDCNYKCECDITRCICTSWKKRN